jgi:hypothetical protein
MQNNNVIQPIKTTEASLWLWIELHVLFVIPPLTLALPLPVAVKLTAVLLAIIYCGVISKKMGLFTRAKLVGENWCKTSKSMLLRFIIFAVCSVILVGAFAPQILFSVILANPWLWIGISCFYCIFSVYPQEFLYRLFFFKRYQCLVSNPKVFVFFNAAIFCFAHVFFQNILVFLLTFVGGIIFALTFQKSKSTMLVSLEHCAYGVWLFTLGLGDMLAFPGA